MNTKHLLLTLATIILTVLAVLYVQLSIAQEKLNEQRQVRLEKEWAVQEQADLREACLRLAFEDYDENWKLQSRQLGRTDNLLPSSFSSKLEESYRKNQELCIKKYPL